MHRVTIVWLTRWACKLYHQLLIDQQDYANRASMAWLIIVTMYNAWLLHDLPSWLYTSRNHDWPSWLCTVHNTYDTIVYMNYVHRMNVTWFSNLPVILSSHKKNLIVFILFFSYSNIFFSKLLSRLWTKLKISPLFFILAKEDTKC